MYEFQHFDQIRRLVIPFFAKIPLLRAANDHIDDNCCHQQQQREEESINIKDTLDAACRRRMLIKIRIYTLFKVH